MRLARNEELNTTAMTDKTLITDDELINLRAVENKGLWMGKDGYIVYWSDGDKMISHHTHTKDKTAAESALKNQLMRYWLCKANDTQMKAMIRAIRSMSKIELAEFAAHVQSELEIRGMRGNDIGWRPERRRILRIKDYIWMYYDRKDLDE